MAARSRRLLLSNPSGQIILVAEGASDIARGMATTLYTLDRRNVHSPGTQFGLRPPDYAPLGSIFLDQSFRPVQFPQGLSNHGQQYLINWSVLTGKFLLIDGTVEQVTYCSAAIEIVFELVRRLEFSAHRARGGGNESRYARTVHRR